MSMAPEKVFIFPLGNFHEKCLFLLYFLAFSNQFQTLYVCIDKVWCYPLDVTPNPH